MSHFTNLRLAGAYTASGTLFDEDGVAYSITGNAFVTLVVSHGANGAITGTWQTTESYVARSIFGTDFETESDFGFISGTVSGATNSIQFVSLSPDSHTTGIATLDPNGSTISFSQTITVAGFSGSVSAHGVAIILGTEGADILFGTEVDDRIEGRGGDDQLSGKGGNDRMFGEEGNDTVDGGEGDDRLSGGTGNDTLVAGAGSNLLDGGDGSDQAQLPGQLADYRVVVLDGPNNGKLFFTLGGLEPGDFVLLIGPNGRQRTAGVESIKFLGNGQELQVTREQLLKDAPVYVATQYLADDDNQGVLNGGAGDDVLDGLEGSDSLSGGAGNDTLDGGAGNDALIGGAGNDTYIVDSSGDTVTELASQGTADLVKTALDAFTLAVNVEQLLYTGTGDFAGTGNAGANKLTGGAGNDTLDGGAGADRMEGGAGNDTYFVDRVASADGLVPGDVVVDSDGTADTVHSSVSYTLGANVENLVLTGALNINGTGNTLANSLTGNTGNNVLNGGAGNDTFFASGGNDRFVGGVGNDTLNLSLFGFAQKGATGGFTVTRPDANTVVITDADSTQKFTLTGAWGATTGTERGIESLVFSDETVTLAQLIENTGSALADTFNAIAGANTMTGGAGNDTYTVDHASDLVVELPGQGTDLVKTALDAHTLAVNVEQLLYTGSGNFTGTGNASANKLTGGAGNDSLDGGLGADRMEGGAGDDTYFVNGVTSADGLILGDVVFEGTALLDSGGTDTVRSAVSYTLGVNVENLVLTGTGNTNGTGNALANSITGTSGNNILSGGVGNDILNGGLGTDTLRGGAGADQFNFDNLGPRDVIADFASGTDSIALEDSIFSALEWAGGELVVGQFQSVTNIAAASAGMNLVYNSVSGQLLYDADGAGTGEAGIVVALLGSVTHPALTAADFMQL